MILRTVSALYLFYSLLCLSAFKGDHALYIGVVQIVQEEADTSATIQVKVFSDDLQSVLQNQFTYSQIPAVFELCEKEELIQQYFQDNLRIIINQQPTSLLLKNCESINDVHLLRFHTTPVDSWNTVLIEADFFMELFPNQSNVISIAYTSSDRNATLKRMGRCQKGDAPLLFQL